MLRGGFVGNIGGLVGIWPEDGWAVQKIIFVGEQGAPSVSYRWVSPQPLAA